MTTVQILGLIMAIVGMTCGTVLIVTAICNKQNNRFRAEQLDKQRRQSAWNETFNNEAMLLYETYREKCESLEVQNGILKQQLKNARELLGKVKVSDVQV